MAVTITFTQNIFSIYQTFFNTKYTDLVESLAWLINDEKQYGSSKEQAILITRLAQFYYSVIEEINSDYEGWSHLNWLTQAELDIITEKLRIESVSPTVILVPGALPITPTPPIYTSNLLSASFIINLVAEEIYNLPLGITSKPYTISAFDSNGTLITSALEIHVIEDTVISLDIYSIDTLSNVEIRITYANVE